MKMNSKNMTDMTRILTGEASEVERKQFYDALDEDADKKQAFETLEKEWIAASNAMLYKSLDTDAAWQRHKDEYLGLSGNEKSKLPWIILKWVAVIIVAIGLAVYFVTEQIIFDRQFTKFSTGIRETLPVKVPDGSTITLNQNTTITYNINKAAREVNFTGEAYFDVAADPQRPFIIEMEKAYIKVIGTAFNVKTKGSSIDVVVTEGVVEFGLKDRSEKTLIKAGSMGKLSGKYLSQVNIQKPNVISWYTKKLVFDRSPLTEVFSDISDTYYVNFQYDSNKLKNCRLTADFNNEELTNVLETLRTIFKVDFKKDKQTYVVTGSVCEPD